MEDPSFVQNDEDAKLHELVEGYFQEGDHIKALEVIEDSISSRGIQNFPPPLYFLQGLILSDLSNRTEDGDIRFAFLLGSVECFTVDSGVHERAAFALMKIAEQLGSALYYRKAVKDAKLNLSFLASFDRMTLPQHDSKLRLEDIIETAESKILLGVKNSAPKLKESKEVRDKIRSDSNSVGGERLRSYWAGMNAESKKNFVKVSTVKLRSYVERVYGSEGQVALEEVLDSARLNKKWKFWMCKTCREKFYYPKKFKNHLEQEHKAKFKASNKKHMAQRVDEVWAGMITVAGWEPVDTVAAAELIKTRIQFVKAFVYENGWSKDWPLAADEERSKLLKEIQLLLVLFWQRKILSCSLRGCMMHFLFKHLAQFGVSVHTITKECRLVETPQSICFLESGELNQILDLLKLIKCERADGTELICRAVDGLWSHTRVKEKIEFDPQFSSMLLDKRLLRDKIVSFDDDGKIDVYDQNVYYAKTHPQGDDFITLLLDYDYPLREESFEFPRSIRAYNLDIWVAALRTIHYTCRAVGVKYAKKLDLLCYDAGLIGARNLCICEYEKRRSVPEDQWKKYTSLLGDKCEERLTKNVTDARELRSRHLFLCAVRDVLEGASHPKFDLPDLDDCLNVIREHKNISDEIVVKSMNLLRSVVAKKLLLIDSKMLLVENSRINLLNDLTRLSVFDYRSYILHLLKRFLREELDGIIDLDAKAKVAAAEADLLSGEKQEKEKNSGSKKKKHRSFKRTSTSMNSHLDQNVKHKHSVNLEPECTSPSVKTVEENSVEPEDTLPSERGQLEISSNTNNQEEEATEDMQNGPGEGLLSKHSESVIVEGAARYNSALAMTLKAICNVGVLKKYLLHNRHEFPDDMEEQVPDALRNFFMAFVSKQMKEEGLYTYLLGNVLASLEEVNSMSSDAAELLVSILEFWPCWKSPEIESVVTHLFTLEEYERMSCSKCRKKPNYPGQSSYGVVMAADSIRDLKCAFGDIKFVDIVKVIRMEDKMVCDIKTGGCGKANFIHHIITTCPPIFTIVLEWKKCENEKEISDTTKALEWEIDISRLYEGLELETKYRLVSMVGCGEEEEEHMCLAYKKNRWVRFRNESLAKEVVGNWKSVVRFCGERKVRPKILFYEAVQCPNKLYL